MANHQDVTFKSESENGDFKIVLQNETTGSFNLHILRKLYNNFSVSKDKQILSKLQETTNTNQIFITL